MHSIGIDKVFMEKISGKDTNRPQLKAMIEYVRDGDVLYIESISRLARSTRDLLKIVDTLNEKGVQLVSSKENIDTTTPTGRFVLSVFAALSELEREQTLLRQREGIEIAKAQGKYKGRQPVSYDKQKMEALYPDWKTGKLSAVDYAKQLGLKKNTFYRRLKEYQESL